jgi:hypothetical protein
MEVPMLIASIIFGWLFTGYLAFRIQLAFTGGIKENATYEWRKVVNDYGQQYQKRYGMVPDRAMYWDKEPFEIPAKHYNPRDGLKWMLYGFPMLGYQLGILLVRGVVKTYRATARGIAAVRDAIQRFLTSDGFNTSPVVNKFFGLK